MSRSYKKIPIVKDNNRYSKLYKQLANKKYRRNFSEHYIRAYKKYTDSWYIHDFVIFWSWEDAKKDYYNNRYLQKKYKTIDDFYNHWKKEMLRK